MSLVRLRLFSALLTALLPVCLLPCNAGAADDGSWLGLGWRWAGDGTGARSSWEVRLGGALDRGPSLTLQLGGASPGAVPVGRRSPGEFAVAYGSIGWEEPYRSVSVQVEVSRGRRYPGFPGALGLVDGTVVDEATRAGAVRWKAGAFEAGGLAVMQVPLWYTHGRRVAGDAWAVRLRSGDVEVQAVVADTGPHRLDFLRQPSIDVRRMEAAVIGAFRLEPAPRTSLTVEAGLAQRAQRDGAEVAVENGWAIFAGVRRAGTRPGWRLEGRAISPSFDSPLWGEEAPARGRAAVEGRWSWARGPGPLGGWVFGTATQDLASGRAGGEVEAGWNVRAGTGALVFGVGAQLAAENPLSVGPALSFGYEGRASSLTLELDPDCGVEWAGQVRPGRGWHVKAAWRPAPGIARLEVGWAPAGSSRRAWPPPGVRLVGKWSQAPYRSYLFAEAGWTLGDAAALGVRWGRWDEGRVDLFYDEPPSLLLMLAWRVA